MTPLKVLICPSCKATLNKYHDVNDYNKSPLNHFYFNKMVQLL